MAGDTDRPLHSRPFGQTGEGAAATLYTLESRALRVRVTDFGGRLVAIEAPDRHGSFAHVLLGFDDVATYATAGGSFGALLGRCANRIAGGAFDLDGVRHELSRNDGASTLHGGADGFGTRFWTVTGASDGPSPRLSLRLVSVDGDQGFPGELTAEATYRLDEDRLWLDLRATTTRPTIVNLSVHPYFNLAGTGRGDVLGHEIMVAADAFLPTDAAQIPTGEIRPVEGTVFDFRAPAALGSRIRRRDAQLLAGTGYDHCFVLRPAQGIALAARIREPLSGRMLDVHADQPGLQVYSGNKLNGSLAGHGDVIYRQSDGLALEPQNLPDAPHHPEFPSAVLRPGQVYARTICYRFHAV